MSAIHVETLFMLVAHWGRAKRVIEDAVRRDGQHKDTLIRDVENWQQELGEPYYLVYGTSR